MIFNSLNLNRIINGTHVALCLIKFRTGPVVWADFGTSCIATGCDARRATKTVNVKIMKTIIKLSTLVVALFSISASANALAIAKVPEPSSLGLLALAVVLVGVVGRKK